MMAENLLPILVGGVPTQGRGGPLASVDPADGTTVATVAAASELDVDDAVARAVAAQADPAWQRMLPHVRARLLTRTAEIIEARAEELALLQSRDNGKPITETRALVASAAGTFRYVAAVLESSDERLTVPRGQYLTLSVHEPIGVVGAITPWNSPIASDAQKLAPALAGGNAVLLKPAGWAPLVSLKVGEILLEAGFPAGLVSVLPGAGGTVGQRIVDHPAVGHVSFTGGTDTGRRLAESAARKLMTTSLELGGKSPTIVFDDADLDVAVNGVLYGIFSSQGQSCIAGSRLFVQRSVLDEVVARLSARADALRVGHPRDERTQMGPLITDRHRTSVEEYIGLGVAEGGKVVAGGARPADPALAAGTYLRPTIITGVTNASRIAQEEIFGPVLVVIPFDDESDLIAQANDTVYGLAAGVWTRDFPKAWRTARALQAGQIWINTYKQLSVATPFGGFKDSGSTREKGADAIRAYQRQKSVYVDVSGTPIPWAD
ncbi:aldehyde dehydrogenase [Actinocorallia sp. A-T 12471]|uniref:aldehyde dehydrogenase n=1 Tax=Actinocorallia sp. A-T 12471 TaxID=3089813 RepID=UPI0029D03810|nr:aldehyde dehydrogenase [Actinocorallia sp. A-T 12471]MDX6739579.1 aldehyde dehydrogenase [Actinocorallia sp. A-T 12471]